MDFELPIRVANSVWEFGWDALVAISTFAVGAVAWYVGLLPARLERKAQKSRAAYLSIILAAELETAMLPALAVEEVAKQLNPGDMDIAKFRRCLFQLRNLQLPVLDRVIGKLDCFDEITCVALAEAYAAVVRVAIALPKAERNEGMRTMDIEDGIPVDVVLGLMTPLGICLGFARKVLEPYSKTTVDNGMKGAVDELVEVIHSGA